MAGLAEELERLDADPGCRAVVVCSPGRHFCAGADFRGGAIDVRDLYTQALRLFSLKTPSVAAVQGAAVGGGMGLALAADLRVAEPGTRFQANFVRLGIHHGFAMSETLPALVGAHRARELLYTGRAVRGEEAFAIGLCDRLAHGGGARAGACELAGELASGAPLALQAIRATLREELLARVPAALEREAAEQARLFESEDFREGVRAASVRDVPRFQGR
jgi:enoyl-CoA hydratase/carnithine racemase